ncbi:MAG: GyrI-like domain-containing protein [Candidatus Riflebacteria bacterium]|nr:GyrI-like domain-containing protein [Candidatus Riflebacteria bacterium]
MKKILFALAILALCCGSLMAVEKASSFKAEVRNVQPFTYMCLEGTGPYAGLPQLEKSFLAKFKSSGLKAADKEITVYWNSPFYVAPEDLEWDIGYPVASNQTDKAGLKAKKFEFNKVAVAMHVGSYETTYITINSLYKWIVENKLVVLGGPCVERYFDAPNSTTPDSKKKTEIWIPIQ